LDRVIYIFYSRNAPYEDEDNKTISKPAQTSNKADKKEPVKATSNEADEDIDIDNI
jgi:hypothetical protein